MKHIIFLLFTLISGFTSAQTRFSFEQEMDFVDHLRQQGFHDDVVYTLQGDWPYALTTEQQDSVNYLLGVTQYQMQDLSPSAVNFLKVSPASGNYLKSRFFAALNHNFLEQHETAFSLLRKLELEKEHLKVLQNMQLAGTSLLNRNFEAFDQYASKFDTSYYSMANEQKLLRVFRDDMLKVKKKSPAVAGLLSAVVPGLGKIYAGRPGQGVATFSIVSILGFATYETLQKDKKNNILVRNEIIKERAGIPIQSWVFGSLFSIFYVGNIYGSAFSVKIERNDKLAEIDEQILFNLHIPLRTIFN